MIDNQETGPAGCLVGLVGLLMIPVALLWNAYVLSVVWRWSGFEIPGFSPDWWSWLVAYAVLSLLRPRGAGADCDSIGEAIFISIGRPAVILGAVWLLGALIGPL